MSEPYAAFMRLYIARPTLVSWLDAPPPDPARWGDWRDIGGRWYVGSRIQDLAEAPDADVATLCAEARSLLAHWPSNRTALRGLLREGEAAETRHFAYDPEARTFVAGTLLYDENLIPFLAFLALARGAEAALGADGGGVAAIHNYVFGDADGPTLAALGFGPGPASRLLAGAERTEAARAFQEIADAMLAEPHRLPVPVDQLDDLR
jgi:hypothetical protein